MRRTAAHPGFTLIELLAAAALAAVLMGAVLVVMAALGRDRARLSAVEDRAGPHAALTDLLRWDLTNAATFEAGTDGRSLVLTGHGSLDPRTFRPNGRLVRIVYRALGARGAPGPLVREQAYLDDPIRPEPWTELAAAGAISVNVVPTSRDAQPVIDPDAPGGTIPPEAARRLRMPSRLRVRVVLDSGLVDEEVRVR